MVWLLKGFMPMDRTIFILETPQNCHKPAPEYYCDVYDWLIENNMLDGKNSYVDCSDIYFMICLESSSNAIAFKMWCPHPFYMQANEGNAMDMLITAWSNKILT